MIQNVVIGKPIVNPKTLISFSDEEFDNFDKKYTLFTNERFLPKILVEAKLVNSCNQVRKNRPELCIDLNSLDCRWIKWGKNKIYIIVGE